MRFFSSCFVLLALLSACEPHYGHEVPANDEPAYDGGSTGDAVMDAALGGAPDAGSIDAGSIDAGSMDAAWTDSGHPVDWAILTWTAPTMNTDGTPLTDLAGYYVYHGLIDPISVSNSTKLDVGDVTTYTFKDLAPGTHYFAVSCYTTDGTESAFSMTAQYTVPN